jgi:hypothetical protein
LRRLPASKTRYTIGDKLSALSDYLKRALTLAAQQGLISRTTSPRRLDRLSARARAPPQSALAFEAEHDHPIRGDESLAALRARRLTAGQAVRAFEERFDARVWPLRAAT